MPQPGMGFKVAQARLSQKKPLQWEIGAGLLLEGTELSPNVQQLITHDFFDGGAEVVVGHGSGVVERDVAGAIE